MTFSPLHTEQPFTIGDNGAIVYDALCNDVGCISRERDIGQHCSAKGKGIRNSLRTTDSLRLHCLRIALRKQYPIVAEIIIDGNTFSYNRFICIAYINIYHMWIVYVREQCQ